METAYVVTGMLTDGNTVRLDEKLPWAAGKVRVLIEPVEIHQAKSYQEVMAEIHERQRLRGHQPPTKEEVEAYLRSERESWD